MSRSVFMVVALVVALSVSASAGSGCIPREPVRVGAILSLTGNGQSFGEAVRDGMAMAVEDVNDAGGIDGRKLELIVADSRTDAQAGVEAFQDMESRYQPLIYISTLSLNSVVLAPVAEETGVVLVGLVTSAPSLTAEREWVYRYYSLAENEVSPILSTLEELGIESLGILYSSEEYGISVADKLKEDFEDSGGLVKSEPLGMNEEDFTEQIGRVTDMDAVYVVGYNNHYENAFEQLKEAEYDGVVLGAGSVSNPSIAGLSQSEGVYVAAPRIYEPGFIFAREVAERYEFEYGRTFDHFAANGYDAIKIIAELLKHGEISRRGFRAALDEGFIHPGVLGTIHIEPGNHDISFPLYPAQIIDGKLEYRY